MQASPLEIYILIRYSMKPTTVKQILDAIILGITSAPESYVFSTFLRKAPMGL